MTTMNVRVTVIVLFSILFTSSPYCSAATVQGADFPYGRFQLLTPPQENPFPGLGSYYSTIAGGVDTIMWNPASLGKMKNTQLSFSFINELKSGDYNAKYNSTDKQQTFPGQSYITMDLYFTTDPNVTTIATREHTAHTGYLTRSSGLNLKQGIRVNDWLSIGIIERGDTGASIDLSGSFGGISKFNADFINNALSFGDNLTIGVDTTGIATLTITPEGGTSYTQRLEQPLWSGFSQQNSTVPFTTILEARNDIALSAPFTLAGGTNFGKLCLGAAFTPISANANIDNNAKAVVNDGTQDIFLYQPDINPNDEQSMLDWADDPNKYGTALGYKRNTVRVPAGEVVGEARYKGFYQATTARFDLGATYDLHENITFGLVLENVGGASLDFRGTGRVAYCNSRIGTLEAPSFDPTQSFNWSPFSDTFSPVSGTENAFLEEQLNNPLPRKIRFGIALRKPFLILIDYEANQTPIKYKYQDSTTQQTKIGEATNISFLRTGLETSLFNLPCILRSSLVFMFKPTMNNFSTDVTSSVNALFKYKVLPVSFDIGTEFNFWGTLAGIAAGINGNQLISLAQLETPNVDIGKTAYYNIFGSNGPWRVSYLAAFDPGATALAYGNRADKTAKTLDMSYLRYINTLTVSYKF